MEGLKSKWTIMFQIVQSSICTKNNIFILRIEEIFEEENDFRENGRRTHTPTLSVYYSTR